MAEAEVREYAAKASSTDTFGRVMCSSCNHYFVVDGPVWNRCPGEAITPTPSSDPRETIAAVLDDLRNFSIDSQLADDRSLLALKFGAGAAH